MCSVPALGRYRHRQGLRRIAEKVRVLFMYRYRSTSPDYFENNDRNKQNEHNTKSVLPAAG